MKTKTFKELGYEKTPSIIKMIKSCESKSKNMFEIHKDELRRIKNKYFRKKQLSSNQLTYLQLLYNNVVLKNISFKKNIVIKIKPTYTSQHIGMKMLESLNKKKCKTCNKSCTGVYCSEKCYSDND